jgi:hypothetical protein
MLLFDTLCGMRYGEVEKTLYLQHDFLVDFTREGEAILLANDWPEEGCEERVFIILMDMDTECITQLWEFPAGYRGMHPTMFMK